MAKILLRILPLVRQTPLLGQETIGVTNTNQDTPMARALPLAPARGVCQGGCSGPLAPQWGATHPGFLGWSSVCTLLQLHTVMQERGILADMLACVNFRRRL